MREAYRIGEIARQAGVSVETVRYYERIGVLRAAPRTSRGTRWYPLQAVERLRFVKQAQRSGLTLAEIRDLIELKDKGGNRRCQQVRQLLAEKIAQIDAQCHQLESFRRILQDLAERCEESLSTADDPECPVIAKL